MIQNQSPQFLSLRPLALLLLALLICRATIAGEPVFKSVDENGAMVFSDTPVKDGTLDRLSYKKFKGRKTATASCSGADENLLLERFAHVTAFIENGARQNQIDPLLVKSVARVESCFDVAAVSTAGASGIMQLMPKTAASLGVNDVFNAEQNILGGTRYLAEMLQRFEDDLELALAAYNAGPGAVERFGGVPPFPETINYIERVTSHYEQYKGLNRTSAREL